MSTNEALLSASEIDQVIEWARQAGQMALTYFRKVRPERKSDRTYFTQADLAVEQYLVEQFQNTFPDDVWIGEEGARNKQTAQEERVWAIDPIDGTTAFVQGLPGWGIALGLLFKGQPVFGLFYMPLLDDLTYIDVNGIVYRNEFELTNALSTSWSEKPFLAINSTAHHDFAIDVKRTRALGSVGANLVYTARGTATATLITKASLWDLVAGAAILDRLGGELRYLSNKPVDYEVLYNGQQTPEPILAGHPNILAELFNRIRYR